jgi:hypothetical protein
MNFLDGTQLWGRFIVFLSMTMENRCWPPGRVRYDLRINMSIEGTAKRIISSYASALLEAQFLRIFAIQATVCPSQHTELMYSR